MLTKKLITLASLCIATILSTTGCSRVYEIAIIGETQTIDGKPISDVHVTLDESKRDEHNVHTDKEGRFLIRLKVFENEFAGTSPKWTLTFTKEGFSIETLQIDPSIANTDPKTVDAIVVKPYLRPSPLE